jgi:rhamnosyltransferase
VAEPVTVAVPVRNGGVLLDDVLRAVSAQRLDRPLELLVADSASTDGSRELARRHGAEVMDIPAGQFSHGATRNLLVERAGGSHVALITQDAVPADDQWLARLLGGFELADDVAIVFGPYRARNEASVMVRRELDEWFGSLARGTVRGEDSGDFRRLYFTDVNGCVARSAWKRVPFREVAYAEDQLLSRDMLAAGYAKVFSPSAVVIHSHDYAPLDLMRRSFDEWRGLLEVGAIGGPPRPLDAALGIQRAVRDDVALVRREGSEPAATLRTAAASVRHHSLRAAGAALGSRSQHLPRRLRRACSLERRAGFAPVSAGAND